MKISKCSSYSQKRRKKFVKKLFSYLLRSVSSDKLYTMYKLYTKCIPLKTKSFSKTFYPYCIDDWNKLNPEIRNAKSINLKNQS